jgi:RNA polymerase sigma-70 factor (ECF subfamily)
MPTTPIISLRTKLQRLLRSRGRSPDDTDDLIQEAFLRLQLYCKDRPVEQSEAFLVRTALNLSVDERRRAHNRTMVQTPVELLPLIDTGQPLDEILAVQQRLQRVKKALETMSPRLREVFILHRAEGYNYEQIGEQLGISKSTVEKHMAKAALFFDRWRIQESKESLE